MKDAFPHECDVTDSIDDIKFLKTSKLIKPRNASCARLASVRVSYRGVWGFHAYCEEFNANEEQSKNYPDLVILKGPLYFIGSSPLVHSCKVVPKIFQRK